MRDLPPTYALRVGLVASFASDGAPYYQLPQPGTLLTWRQPRFTPPLPWVLTERPQLTKSGFKSAANP